MRANRTTREFVGSTRNRELAQRRLEQKLSNNQAIADAHRRQTGGPEPVAGTETQPPHQRPVLRTR